MVGVGGKVGIEESVYVGQVDEDSTGVCVQIDDGTSARDAFALDVVDEILLVVLVEHGKLVQSYGTTMIGVFPVEYAVGVFSDYGTRVYGRPVHDLGTS